MKTKKKRKPKMRLWLVRDIDPWYPNGGALWVVESPSEPWLYDCGHSWEPLSQTADTVLVADFGSDLAPGECVELREVR
ncbi:MAG: hypothetical protein H6590_06095 [Flavobacteriales bacterium]|nr:hypothetical protein [Flavobacteriales bacterium]